MAFKGSLLSRSPTLKRFFAAHANRPSPKTGRNLGVFLARRLPKSEFQSFKPPKGTCTKQNTSFEPLSVRIGSELRRVREERKQKKGRTKVTKVVHFTTLWRRHLETDLNPFRHIRRFCRRYHVYQKWFENSQRFFHADRWKNACFPIESQRPI